MIRVLTVALAIFLTSGPAPAKTRKPKPAAFVQSAAPAYQFSFANEADAENQLLALANHVRAEAGVPPLQWDEGLTRAAREHAAAMAAQQQLSHQFSSEASVHQRLTAATPLHLDRAGENVAYAATVDEVHDNLMHSPPHRENLLNPAYNVAGFGVVRSRFALYSAGFRTRLANQHLAASREHGGRERNAHAREIQWRPIAATGWQSRPRGRLFHGSGGFSQCVVKSRTVFFALHHHAT